MAKHSKHFWFCFCFMDKGTKGQSNCLELFLLYLRPLDFLAGCRFFIIGHIDNIPFASIHWLSHVPYPYQHRSTSTHSRGSRGSTVQEQTDTFMLPQDFQGVDCLPITALKTSHSGVPDNLSTSPLYLFHRQNEKIPLEINSCLHDALKIKMHYIKKAKH